MKATIISIEDWEALYIEGQLVYENHRIDGYDLADHGVLECTSAEEGTLTRHVERHGMPESLEEAKKLLAVDVPDPPSVPGRRS